MGPAEKPGVELTETRVVSILTRTSGYLQTVTSHSLQPYQGCSFGNSLCGQACYVQHNRWLTRGRRWGSFLEARTNAAESYRAQVGAERRWARKKGRFSIFMASSTDPFVPQERRLRITRSVLEAMLADPPDELVVQTHSALVTDEIGLLQKLPCRVHLSIETDRERLEGLPRPAFTVAQRLEAARHLKAAGIRTVITVSPLLPIERPEHFFARCGECADAVVIDHFIGGDGSREGARTRATAVPAAMEHAQPGSASLTYLEQMACIARRVLPGRVAVGSEGFAGRGWA